MYKLFKGTCEPVDYIAERWPQLLPPENRGGEEASGASGADPFGAGPSAEGHERNVQSEVSTEIRPDFESIGSEDDETSDEEFSDMNQKQPERQISFAEAWNLLKQSFEGEGSDDFDEVLDQKLDKLGRIRDAFLYLQKQIRADPVYTSFAQKVKQVFDHPEHWKPLRDPKFSERLRILFTHCRAKRRRIQYLFSCLKDTLSQLAEYLIDPDEDDEREQAIDDAIQSWEIKDELLEPFDGYDLLERNSPPKYFGSPADRAQEDVRGLFKVENLKGWGTPGGVPKGGHLIRRLEKEYERLQNNASLLLNHEYWKLLVWKVQELLNSPPGTQPDKEFQILMREDLRQVEPVYEEIESQWTDFLRMAESLAPLLSQKESTPERDRALTVVDNMWDLFIEIFAPVNTIAEKWPQLLPQ